MAPDKKIVRFIAAHHVLTLATCADGEPYCSNMFYAYMEAENLFVFTSDSATRHIRDVSHNAFVAGSIVLETKIVGKVQGLQLQGFMTRPAGRELKAAKIAYLKKFPYAAVMDLELWTLQPTFFKLTDNRLGFGKKITWQREPLGDFDALVGSLNKIGNNG